MSVKTCAALLIVGRVLLWGQTLAPAAAQSGLAGTELARTPAVTFDRIARGVRLSAGRIAAERRLQARTLGR